MNKRSGTKHPLLNHDDASATASTIIFQAYRHFSGRNSGGGTYQTYGAVSSFILRETSL